jgi:hypothetical protein
MRMAMEAARCVIAQVNPRLPWTDGAAVVPADAFDHVVEIEEPLLEVPPRAPSAAEQEIAARIARLVPDRAVIQLGVGALPDAIAAALADKRDLGVHTGLLTDAFRGLVEAGAVTNRYKAIDTGLSVTTSFLGTRGLYDFVDRNPGIVMRETRYTHGAGILLQLEKLHAINSAIEVDLTGQVNAEIAGGRYLGLRFAGRPRHRCVGLDHAQGQPVAHRGQAVRAGHHRAQRCRYRGHRMGRRRAAGPDAVGADRGDDRYRTSRPSLRAGAGGGQGRHAAGGLNQVEAVSPHRSSARR